MFQFTTTNVINSNKDLTTGKPLWSADANSLNVKRVNNFKKDNIVAIYKAEGYEAENAKATFDLAQISDANEGDTLRLFIYIGLSQASQEAKYSNDFHFKGKPLSVEFVWKSTAAETVKDLVKTLNKYEVLVYGEKLLNVDYSGTKITLEAINEYQRFVKVNFELLDPEAYHGMGDYKVVRSLDDLTVVDENSKVTTAAENWFKGKEGFGTYSYLLHNLRLPTTMRTRAFGVNQDETPIVGALYNQYTIHYCAKRGILGLNAVGDVVKSLTTHVFYVKSDLASDFESALNQVGSVESTSEPSFMSLDSDTPVVPVPSKTTSKKVTE